VSRVQSGLILALIFGSSACKKKYEILPADAREIKRTDSTEQCARGEISLREYRFKIKHTGSDLPHEFLCEARVYPDRESAATAGKAKIVERPDRHQRSGNNYLAQAGRSTWLLRDARLTWCMLGDADQNVVYTEPLAKIYELFRLELVGDE
jgi:hypothetical protein